MYTYYVFWHTLLTSIVSGHNTHNAYLYEKDKAVIMAVYV